MISRIFVILTLTLLILVSGNVLAAPPANLFSVHEPSSGPSRTRDATLDDRDPCEIPCQPGDMIECPEYPGPLHHLEDCDGGCHREPPVFFPIELDWPVCGVGFTYTCEGGANCRDTDWYEFLLPEYGIVEMSIEAEFPVVFGIVDYQPCESADFIEYGEHEELCVPTWITTPCLPPGSYVAYVAPLYFTGVAVPQEYRTMVSFEPCQPPCAGTIQLDTHELALPPTYIGDMSSASVFVTNTGTENLCVDSVTTTGHVWQASPSSFTIGPGLVQPVQIDFLPTFEHDFEGTIEFFSSDPDQPRDSVFVAGLGCRPVEVPPPPSLIEAGSPTMLYFALPWDDNGISTEYAIEYSLDGFVSSEFVCLTEFVGSEPEWQTAQVWGHEGAGAIVGLESNTAYQVRLLARDCAGLIVVGPPAEMSTLPEIVIGSLPELTIMWTEADTVELNWNPEVIDSAGLLIPNFGYVAYMGSEPGLIDSMVGSSESGTLRVATESTAQGFFYVEPVIAGVYDECRPFISWPPDMATVSGLNSVVIQDFAHLMWWDSFRVEIDSFGSPALIGSSFDNPWSFNGKRAAATDFDRFEPGLHTVTATVVDNQDRSWVATSQVMVVPRPLATFEAEYDPALQLFTLDTAGVTDVTEPIAEIYWPVSTAGERYGGSIQFEWDTTRDSLSIVKPFIQSDLQILTDDPQWFLTDDQTAGVVPVPEEPEVPAAEAGFCCLSLDVIPMGPHVQCQGFAYFVGFNFRVEIKWKPWHSPPPTFGQEAKGTRTYTKGKCKGQPPTFKPLAGNAGKPDTAYKVHGGAQFPRNGPNFGNDDYRPNNKHDHRMRVDIRHGVARWQDRPHDKGSVIRYAVRCTGQDQYRAWARTRCPIPPGCSCCKEFEIEWDVTFCKNCAIIQTIPPRLFNVQPCPD